MTTIADGAARRDRAAVLTPGDHALIRALGEAVAARPADIVAVAEADASVAQILAGHAAAHALLPHGADRPDGWYAYATGDVRAVPGPGGGLVLDGTATLSAGGAGADHIVIDRIARIDAGPVAVILSGTEDGLRITPGVTAFGQRAATPAQIRLDHVTVAPQRARGPWPSGPRAGWQVQVEALQSGIELGILQGFLAAARDFVRDHARPWHESGAEAASLDPHTIATFGQAYAQARALRLLVDEAFDHLTGPAVPPRPVVLARWYAHDRAGQIITAVIGVLGASATSDRFGLDRSWRDFHTQLVRQPPHWTLDDLAAPLEPIAGRTR